MKSWGTRLMEEKAKRRNSAFELMRLVAMFMIVWGHCMIATAKDTEPYLGTTDNIGWFVGAFTVCAVNLFFLLTGYYAKADYGRRGKLVNIWIKTIFYSFGIFLIYAIIKHEFNIKDTLGFLFPILTKKYWYMQVYVVLALFTPYIASLLDTLDSKRHLALILIMIVFFSLHQSFIKVAMTLDQSQGYGIIWAVVMFIIGNYICRYGRPFAVKISKWLYLCAYVLCSIAIFISNYLIVRFNIAGGVVSRGNFYAYNSISVFVQSIALFLFFVSLSENDYSNKAINFVGKNTLAIYLISAHPVLLWPLWTEIFCVQQLVDNPIAYIIVSFLLTLLTIFACVFIDKVVDIVISKPIRKITEWLGL